MSTTAIIRDKIRSLPAMSNWHPRTRLEIGQPDGGSISLDMQDIGLTGPTLNLCEMLQRGVTVNAPGNFSAALRFSTGALRRANFHYFPPPGMADANLLRIEITCATTAAKSSQTAQLYLEVDEITGAGYDLGTDSSNVFAQTLQIQGSTGNDLTSRSVEVYSVASRNLIGPTGGGKVWGGSIYRDPTNMDDTLDVKLYLMGMRFRAYI